jgi:hypothetical protein
VALPECVEEIYIGKVGDPQMKPELGLAKNMIISMLLLLDSDGHLPPM